MNAINESATDMNQRKPITTYAIIAMAITVLIALAASYVVARYRQERKSRETRHIIESAGGEALGRESDFIQFKGDAITDRNLMSVRQLVDTESLNLHQTRVSDNGLAAIADWKELKYLGIQSNLLSDVALNHVHGLTQLERLELIGQPITDAGLRKLATLKDLRILDLSSCANLTESGVKSLRAALPNCEIRWSTEPYVPVQDASK